VNSIPSLVKLMTTDIRDIDGPRRDSVITAIKP
jgi:hypothetical protein